MLKLATSSATPANTSRNSSKNPRKSSSMLWENSSARSAPLIASVPGGMTRSSRPTSSSWDTPSPAATRIWVILSSPPSRYCWAASKVNDV